ncbi:hypothetical protein Q5H92_15405 [Hymenobacter sp. M29]|uniref:Uncharacterized protein n=1 Tax=Hymenobacter mellowenesis TaxID=3063995 RepID=A0ABT9AD25_9BACT|nr:hypothetical protein [Hymenobacter sp. M29]MDO7847754.1 hypothetical protein [Hymenobacter sp. M29]
MAEWAFGLLALLGYGIWLYSNRELGGVQLSIAPLIWVLLTALVSLTQLSVLHNPVVSGYSHNDAWVSMNDNLHPESWQLEYKGEDWPFLLTLLAPLLGWLLLKQITEPGALRAWQMRHFRNLGFVVWLALLITSCDTGHRQEYYNQAELPAIGSRVNP